MLKFGFIPPLVLQPNPKLIPFDKIGTQPMTPPTGKIFTLVASYSTDKDKDK